MKDRSLEPLPIDAHLGELRQALAERPNLILEAPTGAGKTTRVPPALVDLGEGLVILVEPRRIAVRAAARRMAQEGGGELGQEVGYAVRMDSKYGPATRLLVVTPGILLRRLLADPFLEGVQAIVFDEFHERGQDADLALAVARQVQREVRPDLRLVLMSATLDHGGLEKWLGDAAQVRSEGRSYPVEIAYRPTGRGDRIEDSVAQAVQSMHAEVEGNLLVFLPGVGEIRRTEKALASAAKTRDVELMLLYGDLDPKSQDRVLQPGNRRRWILATNVAESSVTVHGIGAVIDSGWHRRMEQNAQSGLDHLVLTRISQASAKQRAGRAGRTGPGKCLRLWAAHEQASLPPHDPPEITRVDPAGAFLWLLAFGEKDPDAFGWMDPPSPAAAESARRLLERLGAWDPATGLSQTGREMANLPLHPRLARLLLEGARLGVADRAALAAVLCSERPPFDDWNAPSEHHSDSDVLDGVEALEALRDHGSTRGGVRTLRAGPGKNILRLAKRLEALVAKHQNKRAKDRDTALLRAVGVAFRDRLARRRPNDPGRALMAGQRGVRIAPQSAVHDAELFVCVEIVQGRGDNQARVLSAVEPGWFGKGAMREEDEVYFDTARFAVAGRRWKMLDDLALEEKPVTPDDWEAIHRCLTQAASDDLERALPLGDPGVKNFLGRVQFLNEHMPELQWPELGREYFERVLEGLALGMRSFAELRKAPLLEHLNSALTHDQQRALAQDAPTHIRLPKGRNVRLAYDGSSPPVLASRIQDFFGLAETPKVAQGRVRVLLHLLAPNGRPQQVTDDLPSFWSRTYGEVRKELRRRYPKHDWPEDPRPR